MVIALRISPPEVLAYHLPQLGNRESQSLDLSGKKMLEPRPEEKAA